MSFLATPGLSRYLYTNRFPSQPRLLMGHRLMIRSRVILVYHPENQGRILR